MLNKQQGSILIEGLVAVLIFSIGILALMGMQSVAIKNASQAQYRNEAGQLASQILSQIMVDQANIANYVDGGGAPAREAWTLQVAQMLPNGIGTVAYVDAPATPRLVTVTLNWRAPNEAPDASHQYVISANVMPAEN